MSKTTKYLLIFILVSLVISLTYSFYFHNKPVVDAKKYDQIGWNLAQGLGYRIDSSNSFHYDYAMFMVGPGYQFFLAMVYYLFGHYLGLVWLLQSMALAVSGFLIFLISKELFKENWRPWMGLIAAGLVLFSPDLIMVSSMVFSDTLGLFLMVLSVWLFLKYQHTKNLGLIVATALSLAAATMVRSVLVLLIPLSLIWLIKEKRFYHALVMIVLVVLVFTPWTYRNWKIFHEFYPFTAVGHMDFWWGNRLTATGELDPAPEIEEILHTKDIVTASQIFLANGKKFVITHPLKFTELVFKRASIYFSFIRPTGWWPFPGPRGYALDPVRFISLGLSAIYSVIIFTLGVSGVFKAIKNRKEFDQNRLWFVIITAVLMPLGILWLFVESRYRFPIYPFLALFSGYFIYNLKGTNWWKNKILWTVFGILSLNSGYDIVTNVSRILERL